MLISKIPFGIFYIFKQYNVLQMFFFNLVKHTVHLFTNKQDFFNINAFKVFQAISEFARGNTEPYRRKFDRLMLRGISKQQK